MNAQRPRSKKRSAGKERRSPTPVFLIDQCLGRHALATALAARCARAETLARHFADDTPDHEWLAVAGKRRWVVLTKDSHFRQRPLELAAILASNVRAFVLSAGKLTSAQQVEAFERALPRLLRLSAKHLGAMIGNVTASGSVQVYSRAQLTQWLKAL